ncbi:hypothetical protein ETD86_35585 [Nonomuraea turkmeniaca]|uniref:Uncharacterized protein n=1 Tax=Nonomuraea turkmeniaca TaxID=103838 RepID=A0A5S4F5U3_9ACTN|nr:DUF6247 family protein [Nonomuraea turkmeniaca]TMR11512.1 hypothetical protein ETD86_35585 [Nonomuraea turkmeniaca]
MTAEPHGAHRTPAEIRASIRDDRSPKAIRAALPTEDRGLFDHEYRVALDQAKVSYDLAPVHAFQDRWWAIAVMKADPDDYLRMLETAERVAHRAERGE